MKIERFEDVQAWQEARQLVGMVYKAIANSERFKKDFGLRDQAGRAAVSVMSNIAEGFSRQSDKEFKNYLYISKASAAEIQSVFYAALDLGYVDSGVFDEIYRKAETVAKLNSGFIKYLSKKSTQ